VPTTDIGGEKKKGFLSSIIRRSPAGRGKGNNPHPAEERDEGTLFHFVHQWGGKGGPDLLDGEGRRAIGLFLLNDEVVPLRSPLLGRAGESRTT